MWQVNSSLAAVVQEGANCWLDASWRVLNPDIDARGKGNAAQLSLLRVVTSPAVAHFFVSSVT